ncbi:hypothetical protein [Roseobacter sp. MH60115]|uniref:hypothetical protein n=1 Tax=Roseobacter sp. MH60115 TaxID=2785324 RepID=UPI0018A29158|nr:hypothetical protein [Roseobacter sp. MH60115]
MERFHKCLDTVFCKDERVITHRIVEETAETIRVLNWPVICGVLGAAAFACLSVFAGG